LLFRISTVMQPHSRRGSFPGALQTIFTNPFKVNVALCNFMPFDHLPFEAWEFQR
jgi:hypothetical protein